MADILSLQSAGGYGAAIGRARQILEGGGVVVLPTETVYGAAGLLNHPTARQKLRELRGPENGKPFIVHLAEPSGAEAYLGPRGELAQRMINKLWPGPVALQFDVPGDRQKQVAKSFNLQPGDLYDSRQITLRCPDHPAFIDITTGLKGPLVVTQLGTTRFEEVGPQVELVIDAGPTPFSRPSTIVRVSGDQYDVVREGVYDRRIIERLLRTTILFVCSGNTCRSPMAEALTRSTLSKKLNVQPDQLESKGVIVMSAGSYALPGSRATPQAVDAVRELGGDLSQHRSRMLSVELIHQADHIFTMGRSHQAAVAALVPAARDKIISLNPDGEIDDPIGGDTSLYLSLARHMEDLIERQVVGKVQPTASPAESKS